METQIAKIILNKKIAREINIPDFKLFHRVLVIGTVWYLH